MKALFVNPRREKIHQEFMKLQSSYEEYDQRPDTKHLEELIARAGEFYVRTMEEM